MALNFPASPVIGQIYSAEGGSWVWTGTIWSDIAESAVSFAPLLDTTLATSAITLFIPPNIHDLEISADNLLPITDNSALLIRVGSGPQGAPVWMAGASDYTNRNISQTNAVVGASNLAISAFYASVVMKISGAAVNTGLVSLRGFNNGSNGFIAMSSIMAGAVDVSGVATNQLVTYGGNVSGAGPKTHVQFLVSGAGAGFSQGHLRVLGKQ